MATQRSSFAKIQREMDKKARAAAKRERRLERASATEDEPTEIDLPEGEELSPAELLRLVEATHADYDAGLIDLDTFQERKAALLARLPVE